MPSEALRLAALVLWAVCGAMAKATVNSTDGGYENLLVAIEENVPYHPDIVNNIMVLFRKASQFLLVATRGKFYFKDVMILTPNTWPSSSDAETMWEDPYKEAEVQISDGFTLPGILEAVPLRAVSPNPVQTGTFPTNRTVFTTFRLFQRLDENSQRVVLVLDVSYSMRRRDGDDRLTFLQYAMNHMIRHMLRDYQALGIVTFSGRCQVAHPLVVLNTTDARDGIARVIDGLVMGSGTSIGCGLSKAIEMLEGNGTSARGGLICLVTDGEENYKPWIVEQLPILVSKGVKVSTFALGTDAEKKLEDVALQTGGTAYAFGNLKANPIAGLTVSFLLSTTATMPKEEQYVVELGHETKILVTTPNDEDYDLEVEDSNGKVCAACNVTLGKQSTNIDMPRTSTTDTWRLVVKPKAASIANITVVVLSKQRVPGQDPIRAESSVEYNNQQTRVYSKVTKGTAAVLGALVTATVTFGGPGGTGETLQLLDNGIGADNLKDDGDYSAFFTQLKGAGRYSVRTDVKEERVNEELSLVAYAGSVQVKSDLMREDLPPAPIRDLVVSEATLDDEEMTATLSWTSMGYTCPSVLCLLENSTMMKQRLPKTGFLYTCDSG
ncbi:unnamed protein product [Ixodes persulcatus]